MTISTPLEKADTLINTINEMVKNGVDHIALNDVRAEAQKLEDIGFFVAAKRVKGMISALEWDFENVNKQFLAAVRASGNEFYSCVNYASALCNIGDLKGGVEWIDRVAEMSPDNVQVIKESLRIHLEAFDVDGAEQLILQLRKLGVNIDVSQEIADKRAILDYFKVSWIEIAERIKKASYIISKQGTISPLGRRTFFHDGNIFLEFVIHSSVEDAFSAETRMLTALANESPSKLDKFLVLSCEPV